MTLYSVTINHNHSLNFDILISTASGTDLTKPTHISAHSYYTNPNHEQISHNKNEAVYAIESFALSQRRSYTVARFADVNQSDNFKDQVKASSKLEKKLDCP